MKLSRFLTLITLAQFICLTPILGQNVGVGTTSPAELFTVADTIEPVLRLESTNGGLLDWEARVANGDLIFRGGADASGIGLTDYISFSSDGFVGIGELFPAAKLHIRDGAILSEGIFIGEYNGAWPTTGSGARLMWVPEKDAFCVGHLSGVQLDLPNLCDCFFVRGGVSNKTLESIAFEGGSNFGHRRILIPVNYYS
jgi:hypothetical protein